MLAAGFAATAASAQALADQATTDAILSVREKVRAAAAAKDVKALEAIYADNFSHIRETGRTDLKAERIAILVAGGEGMIETAPEEEMIVLSFGQSTAIATGVSPVKDRATGRTAAFQWLTVYVKLDGQWRIAVSQANRVAGRR